MKKIESLSDPVALMFSLWLVLAGCGVRGQPEGLYVSPGVVDLGELQDHDLMTAEFDIVNSTSGVVAIIDSKVSCGCSELTLEASVISPGESVTATLNADIDGLHGNHVFEAVLYTDRQTSPEVRLIAKALLTSTKPVVGFHQAGKCVVKQTVSTSVVVRKEGSTGIQIVPDQSDVKLVEIRDVGDRWICVVEFEAPDYSWFVSAQPCAFGRGQCKLGSARHYHPR